MLVRHVLSQLSYAPEFRRFPSGFAIVLKCGANVKAQFTKFFIFLRLPGARPEFPVPPHG